MSFLGDIVSSIGGEKAPAPPIRPPSRPSSTKPQTPLASSAAHSTPAVKPVYKGTAGLSVAQQSNGLKRKADDALVNESHKAARPVSSGGPTSANIVKSPLQKPNTVVDKPTDHSSAPSSTSASTSKPVAKPPSKGSYAEMLARAKQTQQVKTPSQIGMIKHQATEKAKISKVAERMRKEQDKGRPDKSKVAPQSGTSSKKDSGGTPTSPAKKADESKTAKGPRPPLHGPPQQYKGTMGMAPKKPRHDRSKGGRRQDEYLGTDEEDEGDYDDYGEGEDYYSDASSDMEGGFDDIEQEESKALRDAREDDARELALEQKLKKDKLERKQRLQAMASKRK